MASKFLIDNRVGAVVSPTGGNPVTRMAHFLNSTGASSETPIMLPRLAKKCSWPVLVEYHGWRDPQDKWTAWVDRMSEKHEELWQKVGISEAVQFSKYSFEKNDDLIKNFAERWCPDSNTFVFPWGEATVTLEDLRILGGLPVLGNCAFSPVSGDDLIDAEKKLKRFPKSRRHHQTWLDHYTNHPDSLFEHVAFLSLWLSRFVLPGNEVDTIGEHVFPIAASLSRGVKVALAPAVLANIYHDLGILKNSLSVANSIHEAEVLEARGKGRKPEESVLAVSVWSPLQFLQLWIWERFVVFRPKPRPLKSGEMRAARWDRMGRSEVGNVRPIIDTCGEVFDWIPYCLKLENWTYPGVYREEQGSFLIRKFGEFIDEEGSSPMEFQDEKLESHARCLRSCILVGTDGNEPYQPHRVAMQFGLDQDIPTMIPRTSESAADAWEEYNQPFSSDFRLYVPARLFEGDVSVRYRKWWTQKVVVPSGDSSAAGKGRRFTTARCFKKHGSREAKLNCVICSRVYPSYDGHPPPGFLRKTRKDPPLPTYKFKDLGQSSSSGVRQKRMKREKLVIHC